MSVAVERPMRILHAEHPALERVLIAEDHLPTREALRTLLEQKGYEVSAVSNGAQAMEALVRPDGPSIAVLDWEMPGASGVEVCRAVRAVVPMRYVYLIMITARDGDEDVAQALAGGADDFIRKPCGSAELIARVCNGQRTVGLEHNLAARVAELEELVERIRRLKALLPVCMYCKKVRNDADHWQEFEDYIRHETGTDYSHGICPKCMSALGRGELDAPRMTGR